MSKLNKEAEKLKQEIFYFNKYGVCASWSAKNEDIKKEFDVAIPSIGTIPNGRDYLLGHIGRSIFIYQFKQFKTEENDREVVFFETVKFIETIDADSISVEGENYDRFPHKLIIALKDYEFESPVCKSAGI